MGSPGHRVRTIHWVCGAIALVLVNACERRAGGGPAVPQGVNSTALAEAGSGAREGDTPSATDPTPIALPVEIEIAALGRVLGTIAPCGCTAEPLGGLSYAFGLLRDKAEARLVFAAGSLLFPDPKGPDAPRDAATRAQARKRAEILSERFHTLGGRFVAGVGETDLDASHGIDPTTTQRMPRVLGNPAATPTPSKPLSRATAALGEVPLWAIVELDAGPRRVRVGVTHLIDPAEAGDLAKSLEAPETALPGLLQKMRGAGAEITLAGFSGSRARAEHLARETEGLDVLVVGKAEGLDRQKLGSPALRVGATFVLEPGEQLQTITRLKLRVPPAGPLPGAAAWHVAPSREALKAEGTRIRARLAKLRADPQADRAFVTRLEAELTRLEAQERGDPGTAPNPSEGVLAVFEQTKVTCKGPSDQDAAQALTDYTSWVSDQNRHRFEGVHAPKPRRGQPRFSGIEECDACHEEAVAFWRTTVHAKAYETLVATNQQFDLSCIGCHVTGFREPGGSEVVENDGLRDVQCESCHLAGSRHVDTPEKAGVAHAIALKAPKEVCLRCHTPEHSDTFDYEAYLRDVLGKGHGEKARAALGEGPTGQALRKAALLAAGGSCKKM